MIFTLIAIKTFQIDLQTIEFPFQFSIKPSHKIKSSKKVGLISILQE